MSFGSGVEWVKDGKDSVSVRLGCREEACDIDGEQRSAGHSVYDFGCMVDLLFYMQQ